MASTTAMYTGLTGMIANARNLDVIGNNIANVNTTAFKSNRMLFSNLMSRTVSPGSAPDEDMGGTNPYQIGLGVGIAGTQRNFSSGTVSPTGDSRDLAIEGDGFFVVQRGTESLYTRAGAFRLNSQNQLVDPSGNRVQGYGVDDNFQVTSGAVKDVEIPLGTLTIAEATTMVRFGGNLNASGTLPTRGTSIQLSGTPTTGLTALATANPAPAPGNVLQTDTRLVDIANPSNVNAALFQAGQSLVLSGANKGSKTLPDTTLAITDTTTTQDLMTFLTEALGLNTTVGANPDGAAPGMSLDPTTGMLTITGNTGKVNDLAIESSDFRLLDSAGQFVGSPFVSQKNASADGESVRTTFVAYDSLGSPVAIDLSMVIDSKTNSGTTWRYYVESDDDSDLARSVATGTLDFDTLGQLVSTDPVPVSIDLNGTGAATPLSINLEFSGASDSMTSLTDTTSVIAALSNDGAPIGTLTNYGIAADGTINGAFSNGLIQVLGQVVLARFTNNEGLIDAGGNLYSVGPNSGTPTVVAPGQLGSGRVTAGALEQSNVDLSQEFINMISASTGFSACSRVIRTADELLQQLLVLGR